MDFDNSELSCTEHPGSVAPTPPPTAEEKGEKGETGSLPALRVMNAEFVRAVFHTVPEGATPVVHSKGGDPDKSLEWLPRPAGDVDAQCPGENNNYFNCSSFYPAENGVVSAQKQFAAAYHALVLDDLGTKADADRLVAAEPSWMLETSKDNWQAGFILSEPILEAATVEALQNAVVAAGLSDPGAKGMARWMRLPVGINGKAKHCTMGFPFTCRMQTWNPSRTYSLDALLDALGLQLGPVSPLLPATQPKKHPQGHTPAGNEVMTVPAAENPVLSAIRSRGLFKATIQPGKHDITCPWVSEHTDGIDHGTAYFEPSAEFPTGGFRCQHSHGDQYHIGSLLDFLGLSPKEARNLQCIRIVAGELNRMIGAAEVALARTGKYFNADGRIVTPKVDPYTSDIEIENVSEQALTRELAAVIEWERPDGKEGKWVRADPHPKTVKMLYEGQKYPLLPALRGLARQPFIRDGDGRLVTTSGYDPSSGKLAYFAEGKFVLGELSMAGAKAALESLLDLLDEFRFATDADRSAAVSGMLTAAIRPSLPIAPAFNITASLPGSGKSYLVSMIAKFAGPGSPHTVSYPSTSDEATKEILGLLLTSPAVINFDDMAFDWKAHGAINRMLTSPDVTDRVLGGNRMAKVSTRSLVIGSGNNVEPLKDLRRRVISIRLSPKTATPALLSYKGRPLEALNRERERFVSHALTIIEAWRACNPPAADVFDIASFGGPWADFCRQPLLWLGLPDPATSLQEQVAYDPENEVLGEFLRAWFERFKDHTVTVRKLLADLDQVAATELREAIMDLPVVHNGTVNRHSFGWYLRKQSGRIVNGLAIEPAVCLERNGWRVVQVEDELSGAG